MPVAPAELQRALVAGLLSADCPHVGPFVVLLDAASDNPLRNYAAPARPDSPTPDELDALIAKFGAHGRRPRLEYVEPHEGLTAAIRAAGFVTVQSLPLMALGSRGAAAADVPGIEVGDAGPDELLGAAAVQVAAYGDDEAPEQSARRLARTLASGGGVVVARDRDSGRIVGAGMYPAPTLGFAELAGVATRDGFRRRGIGAAVSAELARSAERRGAHPFLQAGGADEQRMYARIGFETCGSMTLAELR